LQTSVGSAFDAQGSFAPLAGAEEPAIDRNTRHASSVDAFRKTGMQEIMEDGLDAQVT
jgi:hypothetical protein